jgi:hypothetical protein
MEILEEVGTVAQHLTIGDYCIMMNDGFVLQEEAAKALADVLREQILYQLKTGSVGSKTEQLRAIFREFDKDGSKFIR